MQDGYPSKDVYDEDGYLTKDAYDECVSHLRIKNFLFIYVNAYS